jgi:hypothetical protein
LFHTWWFLLACEKRISLVECFSLCLSRACLGKTMIFSIKWYRKYMRFSHHRADNRCCRSGCGVSHCKKTPLFSQLFLCLSRACLGKMMRFTIQWCKKSRFLTRHRRPTRGSGAARWPPSPPSTSSPFDPSGPESESASKTPSRAPPRPSIACVSPAAAAAKKSSPVVFFVQLLSL